MTSQTFAGRNLMQGFLVLAIVALIGWQWQQGEQLKKIQHENEQLRQRIQTTDTIPAVRGSEASRVPDETTAPTQLPPGHAAPAVVEPASEPVVELVATPSGSAPNPKSSGMTLTDIQTMAVDGGIQATAKFSPMTTEPLGVVAVVVRLPRDRDGRILDLSLVGASGLADVSSRISEDGKFAVFHGTAHQVEDLDVVLKVSEPVTADFRGTSGFGPYDMIIEADGAYATQKE